MAKRDPRWSTAPAGPAPGPVVPLAALAAALAAGCWESHASYASGRDAETEPDAEAAADAEAGRDDDAAADETGMPPDLGAGCPVIEEVLDVPPDGCTTLVAGTTDNSCAWGIDDSPAARAVVVRRTRAGTNWSVLIRSRADTGEGRIAYGYPWDDDCARCNMQGSATGGDLRLHGVGGELPRGDRDAVLILDNAGAPMWLRVCDP